METWEEAKKFGVVECENRKVKGFEEKPPNPKTKCVSTGFMSVGKNLFPLLHDYADKNPDSLGGVFTYFLEHKKEVTAKEVEGPWFDVGSFETYLEAHKTLGTKKPQVQGQVDKKSSLSGAVFIGEGAQVQNSVIINSIIYPGTYINGCQISHCIVDQNCNLQSLDLNHKLIRQNTRLSAD